MDVINARDKFHRWTKIYLDQYLSGLSEQQQLAIRLIPLIFQTNHRMLPAFVSADVPAGIYGYKPDNQLITDARKINGRFHYEQQTVLNNTLIDAIYLQPRLFDGATSLILFHGRDINEQQKHELETKMDRLVRWLEAEHLNIIGRVMSPDQWASSPQEDSSNQAQVADSTLDSFYFESILLAGKYPLWWLIPTEAELNYQKMVEHIEHARYVNEFEYIDLGPASTFNLSELLKTLSDLMKQDYSDDSLLFRYCLSWQALRKHSTGPLSSLLKTELLDEKQDWSTLTIEKVFINNLNGIVNSILGHEEWDNIRSLFTKLVPFANSNIRHFIEHLSGQGKRDKSVSIKTEHNLAQFASVKKSLYSFIVVIADRIMELISSLDVEDDDYSDLSRLLGVYHNKFKSPDLVILFNQDAIPSLIQDRILIREIPGQDSTSQWLLVVNDSQDKEYQVYAMKSLLALIAWLWLNRLIDQSTQVSIDSPGYQLRQIDARHAMEVLVRELSDVYMDKLRQHQQGQANRACKSLVFVRSIKADQMEDHMDEAEALLSRNVLLIEQLVIYARGDAHCRFHYGSDGMVQCFCDWLNNIDKHNMPAIEDFGVFSYSSGEINNHAIQLGQLYDEMIDFFKAYIDESASFILRLGNEYFIISQQDDQYSYQPITDELSLYKYLELPVAVFNSVYFHRQVLFNTPLSEIYQNNHRGRVEFYFRLNAEQYDIWVLDERGSLWHSKQPKMDFQQMIEQWLVFIENVKKQYQKASIKVPEFQLYRVGNNGIGAYSFSNINTKGMNLESSEPALVAQCHDLIKSNELSLYYGEAQFDFLEYGDDVITQYAQYLSRNGATNKVWVANVDLDYLSSGASAAAEIQFLYFLKLKRRIEFDLRRMLEQ